MKKLGKKVKKNAGSLQMYTYCNCTNCGCTVHVDSSSSRYTNKKQQKD